MALMSNMPEVHFVWGMGLSHQLNNAFQISLQTILSAES